MTIDRNNYEAFFLDYWEGNLSEQERKCMSSFLEDNPDLLDQFYDFQEVMGVSLIPDENLFFESKDILKKEVLVSSGSINSNNFETFVIASLEGDLTQKNEVDFRKFIKLNPSIKEVISDYRKTYLKVPKSIIFSEKGNLKRKTIYLSNPNIISWSGAVAAIFIIGFVIFSILRNNQPHTFENTVAQQKALTTSYDEKAINDENKPFSKAIDMTRNLKNDPEQSTLADNLKLENQKTIPLEDTFICANPIKDQEINSKPEVIERELTIVNLLPIIAQSQLVFVEVETSKNLICRNEFSTIFEDLFLRDVLRNKQDMVSKEKSIFSKVLANWGNKVLNAASSEEVNNSLVMQIASKGKETVTGFSGLLPVYKTTENDGKKETYLAISESFSIYRSKNIEETQPEKTPNKQ